MKNTQHQSDRSGLPQDPIIHQTIRLAIAEGPPTNRRTARRADTQFILTLAEFLPPSDASLMRAVLERGQRVSAIAAITRERPQSVRRRVRRLTARVLRPEFLYVVRNRARWQRTRQHVAQLCCIEGLTLTAAASTLSMSLYAVRRHRDAIRADACAAATRPPIPAPQQVPA